MMWLLFDLLFVAIILLVYAKYRDRQTLSKVTTAKRGTPTERHLVKKLLRFGIPAQDIFHDLYVSKGRGQYSQIDIVVVTDVGIIVLEVKSLSGWILGRGRESHWTQVLAFGERMHRIYNPILQNNTHIVHLKNVLPDSDNIPYYSVIVFYGDCILKEVNYVPSGTFLVKEERVEEVLETIMQSNGPIAYTDKAGIMQVLRTCVQNGASVDTQIRHRENIKDLVGKHRIFD